MLIVYGQAEFIQSDPVRSRCPMLVTLRKHQRVAIEGSGRNYGVFFIPGKTG